jgi:hypothetical protein
LSCFLVSHHLLHCFTFSPAHCPHFVQLTTIWWMLVSCSYFTQSTFWCSPLCCVLETILLLVASLWKIQFFHCKMPFTTKWSSLLHRCVLPHLAVRPLCPQHGNTKPRCKLHPLLQLLIQQPRDQYWILVHRRAMQTNYSGHVTLFHQNSVLKTS